MTLTEENSTDPQDLLRRVESATRADRELDYRIWHALFPEREVLLEHGAIRIPGQQEARPARRGPLSLMPLDGWSDYEGLAAGVGADRVTASLDAALALVERRGLDAQQVVNEATDDTYRWFESVANYRQRLIFAVLATLLKALIAEQAAGQSLAGKSVDGSTHQTPESPQ